MASEILFLDSAGPRRWILKQEGALSVAPDRAVFCASELLEAEVFRTLERMSLAYRWSDEQTSQALHSAFLVVSRIQLVGLNSRVLKRVAGPLRGRLGTLDAIHFVTALILREEGRGTLRFATHDRELALAARAEGFDVLGV